MAKAASTKKTSSGICNFCQNEIDKRKMTQHLKYCKQRSAIIKEEKSAGLQKTSLKEYEDMFLPIVNSPRVGVCGYTGDADVEELDWDDEEEYESEEEE